MRDQVAPVDRRVAQRAVVRLHVDLRAHAALEPLVRAGLHLGPEAEALVERLRAVRLVGARHPPRLLLLLRRRVDVGEPLGQHARAYLEDPPEPVGGVRDGRRHDPESAEIALDRHLEVIMNHK